jgi:hypothetical protein
MLDTNVSTAPVDDDPRQAMSIKRKMCGVLMDMVIAAHVIMQLERYNDGPQNIRCAAE